MTTQRLVFWILLLVINSCSHTLSEEDSSADKRRFSTLTSHEKGGGHLIEPNIKDHDGEPFQQRHLRKRKKKKKPASPSERPNVTITPRIIGGSNAKVGEFPFFVEGRNCGGTLIWSDIVLSAAHCQGALKHFTPSAPRSNGAVLIGPTVSNKLKGGAQWRKVVQEVTHPKYRFSTLDYDFLVVQLSEPITGNKIYPISINRDKQVPKPNAPVTTMGFGVTDRGTPSSTLKKVTVKAIAPTKCKTQMGSSVDPASMMCAGLPSGGKDSCQGDSGGALEYTDAAGNTTLVGVTSWGIGCAEPRRPGVYSRVSAAADWIDEQICLMSQNPPNERCREILPTNVARVTFQYDFYPHEISWQLQEVVTGTRLLNYPRSSTNGGLSAPRVERNIKLRLSTKYVIAIQDSYGDGMPGGFVEIQHFDRDFQTTLLVKRELGNFGRKLNINFQTPKSWG